MKFSKSFSLFKGIKREPNSFSYRSRFYDGEKEEREKRKKGVELELAEELKENRSISLTKGRKQDWMRTSYKNQVFNSNVIIIIVLIFLCFISYAVIKYLDTVHV